jgi:para-aminobenzoate synthetase component I
MKKALNTAVKRMNDFGALRIPFFFIFDFNLKNSEVLPLIEVNPNQILFNFEGKTNAPYSGNHNGRMTFEKYPPAYAEYLKSFNKVILNLMQGNSYLVNLTFETGINTSLGLYEIFKYSKAKYRLWFKDKFVVFSPEPFVKITNGDIYSFPMKGTIDASVPDADNIILSSIKETAEHNTIVDLIRNDLSRTATEVRVESFRYIEKVETAQGDLLQVSSRIKGKLPDDYRSYLGDIFLKMLPAGSVTGAPKEKTIEIIKEAETYNRGYYTGVAGIYDGENVNSCVMIRFIEKRDNRLYYKSGGGITIHSKPEEEYDEMVKKVYVPLI